MENASKALLIAGGILIVMILASIILIVKNNVANYYASEDELKMIEDKTKFNEQFSRFNRDDVQGYELISLVNKVVDYNERVSTETQNGNNIHVEPIKLVLTLYNTSTKTSFVTLFSKTNSLVFFNNGTITQSNSENQINALFGDTIKNIEKNKKYIAILTKKIDSIVLKKELNTLKNSYDSEDMEKMLEAIGSFNSAVESVKYEVSFQPSDTNTKRYEKVYEKYEEMINEQTPDMYIYYEYVQFKKAIFKCTKLHYDESTGKVDELNFKFTGKIE